MGKCKPSPFPPFPQLRLLYDLIRNKTFLHFDEFVHEDVCVYEVQLHSESEMPLTAFHNAQLSSPSQGLLSVVESLSVVDNSYQLFTTGE